MAGSMRTFVTDRRTDRQSWLHRTRGGSKNTIYLFSCKLCFKAYFGRTTQQLGKRTNGHRECFYQILRQENIDESKDDYSLGLHLFHEHGLSAPTDFNDHYSLQIMEVCSPSLLEKKEHNYIHGYNTLFPIGLNKINPFGLPRLSVWTLIVYTCMFILLKVLIRIFFLFS